MMVVEVNGDKMKLEKVFHALGIWVISDGKIVKSTKSTGEADSFIEEYKTIAERMCRVDYVERLANNERLFKSR